MILSQENLNLINPKNVIVPQESTFELPEKVLQFGTGVLLRGLPDYFIDKANRHGIFNGRIAVVKSTSGSTNEFDSQNSLYTLCVRGIENGQSVSENIISSAISRVISAEENWEEILTIAKSKELKLIVSNTTEVGITLLNESIALNPPNSFPAKVLAVLYERFKAFNGSKESGLIIIATELIPDNGIKLASIVLQLAQFNQLEPGFIAWIASSNTFCNSLVDRIVPGKPDAATLANLQGELGYTDNLLSMTEPYRLWAIEGDEKVANVLDFAKIDSGVVIAKDIEIYRELKVRLLNGTHTLTSGLAFLSGIDTVKKAMTNEQLKTYIEDLMAIEIGPAIPYEVTEDQTTAFANTVKDRFANPSIEHLWINITFQYTMKMKIRILPLLLNYYKLFNSVPEHIALGFAAYLVFMKVDHREGSKFYGSYQGLEYLITDDNAKYFYDQISTSHTNYVTNVLNDVNFWDTDLSLLTGFTKSVKEKYNKIISGEISQVLTELNISKINAV
ncbi:tagaturonate reductase [Pedobacter boryungensis]|uniref:Tagaturonate reductase n=1 Tax=Pedobacter boryungensis TaxID=869962 RepID=A0ABX2DAB2_9SPHI|nr:tagaturonate reductase [Pedobacter boryungensis]NQX30519.1 tagaturonate reductase [Pedobacter boryungensis]